MWCGGVLGLDALSHGVWLTCVVLQVVLWVPAAPILVGAGSGANSDLVDVPRFCCPGTLADSVALGH